MFYHFITFDIYRYESRLCLIACLSITIEFVNWRKSLRCFFISSDLLVGHTSLFRMVVNSLFRSFLRDHIRTVSGLSFDPNFPMDIMGFHLS